jgi:hypothetical protein
MDLTVLLALIYEIQVALATSTSEATLGAQLRPRSIVSRPISPRISIRLRIKGGLHVLPSNVRDHESIDYGDAFATGLPLDQPSPSCP